MTHERTSLRHVHQKLQQRIIDIFDHYGFFKQPRLTITTSWQPVEICIDRKPEQPITISIGSTDLMSNGRTYLVHKLKAIGCKIFFVLEKICALSPIVSLKRLAGLRITLEINEIDAMRIAQKPMPLTMTFYNTHGCAFDLHSAKQYLKLYTLFAQFQPPRQIITVIRKQTTPSIVLDAAYDAFMNETGCDLYYSTQTTMANLFEHFRDTAFRCLLIVDQDHDICQHILEASKTLRAPIIPSTPERLAIDLMKCITLASYTNPKIYAEVMHREWYAHMATLEPDVFKDNHRNIFEQHLTMAS